MAKFIAELVDFWIGGHRQFLTGRREVVHPVLAGSEHCIRNQRAQGRRLNAAFGTLEMLCKAMCLMSDPQRPFTGGGFGARFRQN